MATILVTGANRGIGLALARAAVGRGDRVIATARDPAAASELARLGVDIEPLDVTSETSFKTLSQRLAGRPIDVLVANAGIIMSRGGIEDPGHSMDAWARVMATNVTGVFFTVRALAANVIAARGKIAVISSRMGSSTRATGNAYAYRASKAAASNLVANLAIELEPRGVAVASYHPGWVQTDMGGSGADIAAETSARDLLARIDGLTLSSTGIFEAHDGTPIPH